MKILSTVLVGASLLALSACIEAETATENAGDVNVAADDLTVTDNSLEALPGDTLGNQLNALNSEGGNAGTADEGGNSSANTAQANSAAANTAEASTNAQ